MRKYIIGWTAIPLPYGDVNNLVGLYDNNEKWYAEIESGMFESTGPERDRMKVAAMARNRLTERYLDHYIHVQVVEIEIPWWRRLAAWWRERKSPPQQ